MHPYTASWVRKWTASFRAKGKEWQSDQEKWNPSMLIAVSPLPSPPHSCPPSPPHPTPPLPPRPHPVIPGLSCISFCMKQAHNLVPNNVWRWGGVRYDIGRRKLANVPDMPASCCGSMLGARFVISVIYAGKTPHIAAVIGIIYFTGLSLLNLPRQGFCRDWWICTRGIFPVNAKHAPACSLTADKAWSAGCQFCLTT